MPDGAAGQGAPTGRTGPTSGQFSRWGPAQRPAGPRAVHCRPPSRGAGMGPAAPRTVSAIPMYGSRRTMGFPPRRGHLGTGGPSRRPPSAGCADQRSAFPCLRVAPPGGLGAMRHVQRPRGAFCDSASAPEYETSGLVDHLCTTTGVVAHEPAPGDPHSAGPRGVPPTAGAMSPIR